MQCPVCSNNLKSLDAGGITVDACAGGCGGLWFDQLELKRLDEPHEGDGEALLSIERKAGVHVNHDSKRQCPKCADQIMLRSFYSPRHHVEVDQCPECGGHWLDVGEIAEIRSLYSNDTERDARLDAQVGEQFGAELQGMAEERKGILASLSFVRRMFNYVFPMV